MGELTDILKAFQEQNRCLFTVTGKIVKANGTTDFQWEAKAWARNEGSVDRPLLASALVRCQEKRLQTMESVLLQLLYMLDFQLALEGLDTPEPPKA